MKSMTARLTTSNFQAVNPLSTSPTEIANDRGPKSDEGKDIKKEDGVKDRERT